MKGVVKWFSDSKGFGFITAEDGKEIFVHHSSVDMEGFRTLNEGEEVEFEIKEGPKGLQAASVRRTSG